MSYTTDFACSEYGIPAPLKTTRSYYNNNNDNSSSSSNSNKTKHTTVIIHLQNENTDEEVLVLDVIVNNDHNPNLYKIGMQ